MKNSDSGPKKGVLRTPEECFMNLPGYNFEPHYVMIKDLRVHYVDEGPSDASPILLMHGEPSWSYLYRKMIPILVQGGYRVIAPDLVGFGRSDKLLRKSDYSYQMHVDIMTALVKQLNLTGITLFGQDWGGLIGLRVVAQEPNLFSRIVVGNTGLPDAGGLLGYVGPILFKYKVWRKGKIAYDELLQKPSLLRWVAYSKTVQEFPVGKILQLGTIGNLSPKILAAYEAPFPDESFKAGPRVMPSLIPSQLLENHRAWQNVLCKWEKPLLTTFSDGDALTRGGEKVFQKRIPGAQGQPHVTIEEAGHFLQEDKGEDLAQVILDFAKRTRVY
jgi:haloalkane dehalogenase